MVTKIFVTKFIGLKVLNKSEERYFSAYSLIPVIQVFQSTLKRYQDTLLGSNELEDFYDEDSGEYIIDTDPQMFYTILHFYQTKGHLYCPPSISEERFLEEVGKVFRFYI